MRRKNTQKQLSRTFLRKGDETILNSGRIELLLVTMKKEDKLLLLLVLFTTGILLIGLYTKQLKMNLDAGKGLICLVIR